jgi:uncharacterized damage-inducible protein DinB
MKTTLLIQSRAVQGVAQANLAGLTEDQSWNLPAGGGNSLHWILGHLTSTYDGMLPVFGKERVWDDATAAPYKRYTEPLTDREGRLSWSEIKTAWETAQARFIEALEEMDESRAAEKAPFSPGDNPDETLGSLLALIAFHQAYHVGQLGLGRRAAGAAPAIR